MSSPDKLTYLRQNSKVGSSIDGFSQAAALGLPSIPLYRGNSNGSGQSMAGSSFYSHIPFSQASGYSGTFA